MLPLFENVCLFLCCSTCSQNPFAFFLKGKMMLDQRAKLSHAKTLTERTENGFSLWWELCLLMQSRVQKSRIYHRELSLCRVKLLSGGAQHWAEPDVWDCLQQGKINLCWPFPCVSHFICLPMFHPATGSSLGWGCAGKYHQNSITCGQMHQIFLQVHTFGSPKSALGVKSSGLCSCQHSRWWPRAGRDKQQGEMA